MSTHLHSSGDSLVLILQMVKERLLQPDSKEKGWLLDGYPRSSSQAIALKELGFKPDLFILLEVRNCFLCGFYL